MPAAAAELDLVEALQLLPRFNLSYLPPEVGQMADRAEVIRAALAAAPDAYMELEALLRLAWLLGQRSAEQQLQVRICSKRIQCSLQTACLLIAGVIALTRCSNDVRCVLASMQPHALCLFWMRLSSSIYDVSAALTRSTA